MTNTFDWLAAWYAVSDTEICEALEHQLRIEVPRGHVLDGQAVRLIARRGDTDDALFAMDGGRIAEVHMTWRAGPETDPHWPATAIFSSIDEWVRESMLPLHRELSALW